MRHMIRWPSICAGLLLSMLAHAEDAVISWDAPLVCADGQPLTVCPTTGYRVEKEVAGAFVLLANIEANVRNYRDANLAPGTYRYRVLTVSTTGVSAASAMVQKVVSPPPPSPPRNVTIAVVLGVGYAPAYTFNSSGSRSSALAGFVPLGVTCSGNVVFTYRSRSWRRVDPARVSWWATSSTANVAAPCASG